MVDLDPSEELDEREGTNGPYWAVIVGNPQDGKVQELTMGRILRDRIADLALTKTTTLTIKRTGSGFNTDYVVSAA